MPSAGQFERYISQGEVKISKIKELLQVPNPNKSKVKDLKSQLKEVSDKVKEHKASLKVALKTAPKTEKKVKKVVVSPKEKSAKGPVAKKTKIEKVVTIAGFKALESQVAELKKVVEELSSKVNVCAPVVQETTQA